jgi:rod shape determining protein RodA
MRFSLRSLDPFLGFAVLALAALGTLTLYSAGRGTVHANLWIKQGVFNLAGAVLMVVLANVDHRRLLRRSLPVYLAALGALVLVLALGKSVAGSRSWLSLGGFSLQPSELAKWAALLFVAHRLGTRPAEEVGNLELLGAAGLVLFPMLLVLKQPDLGVAITFLPILLLLPLVRGLRLRWVALGLAGFALLSAGAWHFKLKPYQKERILTFLDPARDLQGKGYQVHQSRIAIGAGGLLGEGFTSGSQTQLNFLPVKTTDFVFSVWAEERGFLGVALALTLFGAFLSRILAIAKTARDASAAYFCAGAAGIFGLHVLINAGMVAGAVPTTGIPLPFFTYGGSSTLSFFIALGVVMNVHHLGKTR